MNKKRDLSCPFRVGGVEVTGGGVRLVRCGRGEKGGVEIPDAEDVARCRFAFAAAGGAEAEFRLTGTRNVIVHISEQEECLVKGIQSDAGAAPTLKGQGGAVITAAVAADGHVDDCGKKAAHGGRVDFEVRKVCSSFLEPKSPVGLKSSIGPHNHNRYMALKRQLLNCKVSGPCSLRSLYGKCRVVTWQVQGGSAAADPSP